MKKYFFLPVIIFVFLTACSSDENDDIIAENPASSPNILFIIADDMGTDATNGYTEGEIKPLTPNIDQLLNNGIKFNNFWVNPTCSPTRSTIITGKYGYTTQVFNAGDELATSHTILQSYINQNATNPYATAIVGKWHLSGSASTFNPETLGIDYYAGVPGGAVSDYYSWNYLEDGVTTVETEYATKKLTDLSIDWVAQQDRPWFLWLAYNAPHTPFHVPPAEMHSQGALPADQASIDANPLPYYLAAIEAMDYQIGELINSMSSDELANTVFIFMGDNGTPGSVAQTPFRRTTAKGSIYQGGINTPLIISGKGINRRGEDNSLINGTDLFATIASLTGSSVSEINDSKNFAELFSNESTSVREYSYSEFKNTDNNTDEWCIRNDTYKLMTFSTGEQKMYNLVDDPYERNNLINSLSAEEESVKATLEAKLTEIRN